MNMQIKAVILYNSLGEKRVISFRPGQVNIITGASRTGKSTLIDIIEYCMGRSAFNVPSSSIQETVAWYAVIYYLGDVELLVAKPRPSGKARSASEVFYHIQESIDPPELSELRTFAVDKDLTEVLSRRVGIPQNKSGEDSRGSFEITIDHTKYYLFQPENVIKNPGALFYRQMEEGISRHIKGTLPFIFGATEDNSLNLENELREKRRELRDLQQKLKETEDFSIERANRAQILFTEAQQVGLIDATITSSSVIETTEVLRKILESWQPLFPQEPVNSNNLLPQLRQQEAEVRQAIHERQEQINAVQNFIKNANGFENEATHQVARLVSIGLYDQDDDEAYCPICETKLQQPVTAVTAIKASLNKLDEDLKIVGREKPQLETYLQDLKIEFAQLRERQKQVQLNIQSILNEQETADRLQDERLRVARVVGRISWYMDTTPNTPDEIAELKLSIERLEREVEILSEKLDTDGIKERLESIITNINHEMTLLAQELELEHQYPYSLDVKNLTVVANRPSSPIVMGRNMGSASNHLGSHLICLLALHKYFIEQNRPVPNFLILDQPSQVYFPGQSYTDEYGNEQELSDRDFEAVNRMFSLFFQYCRELYPELQLIILEHLEFDTSEFHNALVESPWRNGRALIPNNWLAQYDSID